MGKKKLEYIVTGKHTSDYILFPFPDMSLGGNSRIDRRYKTAERSAAREAGFYIIKDAGLALPEVPLRADFILCPPDKIWRDDDNILSAFKSTRDGIFLALEIDDRLVRITTIRWGEIMRNIGGVFLHLHPISTGSL